MTDSFPPPQIMLDTDPGGDDIFALLWLLSLMHQNKAELVAVTTTEGNVSARNTFTNASQILGLAGFTQVEVGRGVPLVDFTADAAHIHGADGMGGLAPTLPAPSHLYTTARQSHEIIIDRLQAAPGQISLVAIGPLTNLAIAEATSPGILQQAKEVVIMGGAFRCRGNVTAQAEFNIWLNPDAAQTVVQSRRDCVFVPLDVTNQLIFTREMAHDLGSVNSPGMLSTFLVQLCEFMIGTALNYRETRNIAGFLVHDAAAIAYLFYPETLMLRRAAVMVETQGTWTRGQTSMDDRPLAKTDANAWVALQVDAAAFFTRFLADLKPLMMNS